MAGIWDRFGGSSLMDNPIAAQFIGLAAMIAVAWVALRIMRRVLVVGIRSVAARSETKWDDRLVDAQLFIRLAHLAPAFVTYYGAPLIPGLNETVGILIRRLSVSAIILVSAMSISAFLQAFNEIYSGLADYRSRPIKGYLQLLKIALIIVSAVLIGATLFDRSPLIFLSGIGAMTAIVLLVFKDTILSLVASVQLTSNDMIRVGDWIEMPQYRADGDIVDIALHTIKVQNWDKTITTIPTHMLIQDSFKNWRGMSDSGGRRIKRSIFVDVNSIRFLDPDEIQRFADFSLLRDYITRKSSEIDTHNADGNRDSRINADIRRLTNIGTLRAYIYAYLRTQE